MNWIDKKEILRLARKIGRKRQKAKYDKQNYDEFIKLKQREKSRIKAKHLIQAGSPPLTKSQWIKLPQNVSEQSPITSSPQNQKVKNSPCK